MSSQRIPQDENIALLQNGENGSQDFDEEYSFNRAGTNFSALTRPLVDCIHTAQRPNDSVQHGTGPKVARRP